MAIDALATLHKAKTDRGGSAGRTVERLALLIGGNSAARVQAVLVDVLASARVREYGMIESATPGFTVGELALAPKLEDLFAFATSIPDVRKALLSRSIRLVGATQSL